jgi:hypothetical protein
LGGVGAGNAQDGVGGFVEGVTAALDSNGRAAFAVPIGVDVRLDLDVRGPVDESPEHRIVGFAVGEGFVNEREGLI